MQDFLYVIWFRGIKNLANNLKAILIYKNSSYIRSGLNHDWELDL